MNNTDRKYWDPKFELLSREEIRILQENRLRERVNYIYAHSPFYRKKFDKIGLEPGDIRVLEDINKIPITDKYELRETAAKSVEEGKKPFHEFSTVPELDIRAFHASSGTTGMPFTYPMTEPEITWRGFVHTGEFCARAYWAAGLRPGDIIAHIWSLGGAMPGGGNHVITKGASSPANYMTLIPCHVGRTELILKMLEQCGCTAICCTPSYASYMLEFAKSIGVDVGELDIQFVMCAGEPGPASIPGLRARLEEGWRARVFDTYGANSVVMPYECEFHTGFHIQSDINIVQIIDPETKEELEPGVYGSIVGTTIFDYNEAFPWLRFNTEDRGAIIEEPCPCGRTHAQIASVPGRWDDMVKVKGYQLHPNAVEKIIAETDGCTGEFIIIVDKDKEDKDRVSITVEHDPLIKDVDAFREKLEHAIRTVITLKANVKAVPVGTLGRYVMKKQRLADIRTKEAREKFDQATKLKGASFFD